MIASAVWLWLEPGPEPVVTLIATVGTFLAAIAGDSGLQSWEYFGTLSRKLMVLKEKGLRRLLGARYRRWHPEADLTFFWPSSGEIGKHRVVANRLWDLDGPTEVVTVTHYSPKVDPYDFFQFRGNGVQLSAEAFDRNHIPEVAIIYHCGAHTMVFSLFALDNYGLLARVPGSEIGSDWPEIKWSDRDGDGIPEIYRKHRNWDGTPTMEYIKDRFVWSGESYKLDPDYTKLVAPRRGED
jgi:hypothetical protein